MAIQVSKAAERDPANPHRYGKRADQPRPHSRGMPGKHRSRRSDLGNESLNLDSIKETTQPSTLQLGLYFGWREAHKGQIFHRFRCLDTIRHLRARFSWPDTIPMKKLPYKDKSRS